MEEQDRITGFEVILCPGGRRCPGRSFGFIRRPSLPRLGSVEVALGVGLLLGGVFQHPSAAPHTPGRAAEGGLISTPKIAKETRIPTVRGAATRHFMSW